MLLGEARREEAWQLAKESTAGNKLRALGNSGGSKLQPTPKILGIKETTPIYGQKMLQI